MENWDCKFHGGFKRNYEKNKRAMIVGTFQPYHLGHIAMVNRLLSDGVPVLILVKDVEISNLTPFGSETVKKMIEKYHNEKGDDVIVQIIPDIESFNFRCTDDIEIKEYISPTTISTISVKGVRNCLAIQNDSWKNSIDPILHDDVLKIISQSTSNHIYM